MGVRYVAKHDPAKRAPHDSAYARAMEAAYRAPYSFDQRNSYFTKVRATDDMATFNMSAHFAMPKVPTPNWLRNTIGLAPNSAKSPASVIALARAGRRNRSSRASASSG